MSSSHAIDHHKPIHYAEEEVTVPADKPFEVQRKFGGTGLLAAGTCPACGGRTDTILSYGISGTKGYHGRGRRQRVKSPVTIFCQCGHAHLDRPAEAVDKGCGRFWLVDIPAELFVP